MSRTETRITLRLPAGSDQHTWTRATRVAWKFAEEFPDRKQGIHHGAVYTSVTDDDKQEGPALIAYRVKSGVIVYVEGPKEVACPKCGCERCERSGDDLCMRCREGWPHKNIPDPKCETCNGTGLVAGESYF